MKMIVKFNIQNMRLTNDVNRNICFKMVAASLLCEPHRFVELSNLLTYPLVCLYCF